MALVLLFGGANARGEVRAKLPKAAPRFATLIFPKDPAQKIPGLRLKKEGVPIREAQTPAGTRGTDLQLHGNYRPVEGWTLAIDGKVVEPAADGDFQVAVPVDLAKPRFEVIAVDKLGSTRRAVFSFVVSTASPRPSAGARSVFLNGGLGVSSSSYAETGVPDSSQISLTAKLSVSRSFFSPSWDFGVTAYITALVLSHSAPEPARFLGANLRGGYHFTPAQAPVSFTLMGGFYYATTFVSDDSYGYKDIGGPQVFPVVRKVFKGGAAAGAYVKFSPVSASLSLLSLDSREIAAGVSYSIPLADGRTASISADYSDFVLKVDEFVGTNRTLTLGVGYGF